MTIYDCRWIKPNKCIYKEIGCSECDYYDKVNKLCCLGTNSSIIHTEESNPKRRKTD